LKQDFGQDFVIC